MNLTITCSSKRSKFVLIALFLTIGAFLPKTFAQTPPAPQLAVGDDAPELKFEKLLKGNINGLEKGKVYVVDIWATWCVPCIAGMAHLSELQQKYRDKGLEIIGITSDDPYGNTIDAVEKFIIKKGDTINYSVAWVPPSAGKDDVRGIFLHPWMRQAGTTNMPTAFIVDRDGKMAFIGDPYTIDKPLDDVVNNRYNLAALRTNYLEALRAEAVMTKFNAAVKAGRNPQAVVLGNQILSGFKHVKPNTYLNVGVSVTSIKGKVDARLTAIALEAIKRGIILTDFKSSGFFDVLAGLHAGKNDYFQAVNAEKLAINLSEGAMRENQIKNLEKYLKMLGN